MTLQVYAHEWKYELLYISNEMEYQEVTGWTRSRELENLQYVCMGRNVRSEAKRIKHYFEEEGETLVQTQT